MGNTAPRFYGQLISNTISSSSTTEIRPYVEWRYAMAFKSDKLSPNHANCDFEPSVFLYHHYSVIHHSRIFELIDWKRNPCGEMDRRWAERQRVY